jgi:hypothetical protein
MKGNVSARWALSVVWRHWLASVLAINQVAFPAK